MVVVGAGVLGAWINAGGKVVSPKIDPSELYADSLGKIASALMQCLSWVFEDSSHYFFDCDSSDNIKLVKRDLVFGLTLVDSII